MSELTLPVDDKDHSEGPKDAPATLVEYGDFECPYCGQMYGVIKEVQKIMGDRLRFVFRHFPITQSHPHAGHAAEFAEAAAEIGEFWAAHDALYEHQWALEDANLVGYGADLGMTEQDVLQAFDGLYDARIQKDFIGGARSGVNGTPSLFINGTRYDGNRDVRSLRIALAQAAES
jgi:protein-disulfide isomerase